MNVAAPIAEGKAEGQEATTSSSRLLALCKRVVSTVSVRRRDRRLRLCEMLPLGEKRFVAVVEYGAERFLLAGTPQRISLLKRFGRGGEAAEKTAESRRRTGA